MRFFRTLTIVFLFTGVFLNAQSPDFYPPKEVKKYRFSHLKIENDKDVAAFLNSTEDYNFIEALKINSIQNLNDVLNKSKLCYSLKELDLKNYKGQINESSFDSCSSIEILHLRLQESQLDELIYLNKIKSLKTLYLYIEGKSESVNFVYSLPQLRELHLIGNFIPIDLEKIVENLKTQNFLFTLGLAIDRTTDIPAGINKIRSLSSLYLYDNLSLFLGNEIEELHEERLDLRFNVSMDLQSAISISYFSNIDQLSEFEKEYFKKIYKAEFSSISEVDVDLTIEKSENLIPFAKNFYPDFLQTPEFNMPYPQIKPNSETFLIEAEKDNVLYSKSGFRLSIPASSFVNPDGEITMGKVYVKITQMTNPIEAYFAGLQFKSGTQNFSSQFSFNVQATGEKNTVSLRENYQLKAFIPMATDSAKAHFYDYESNSWQDMEFYNQVFANNFVSTDFYKLEGNSSTSRVYLLDTSNFNSRFNNSDNFFLNDINIDEQLMFKKQKYFVDLDRPWVKNYNVSGKLKGYKVKSSRTYIKIEKVIPKVRNKTKQYFKIIDKQGFLFPELKPLKNINFNVDVNLENRHEFNEVYVKKIKYEDVRILYLKGQDFCEILLKTAVGYKVLKARFVDTDDKKLKLKQIKKFEKAYAKYLKLRMHRSLEFNRLNLIRFEEYQLFCQNRIQQLQKNNESNELKINQLGTFSFFYTIKPEFNRNLIVQYTDLNGLPLDVKSVFMIDSRYNTIFKIQSGNLNFEPEFTAFIFITDYLGNLYYANKSDIETINAGNNSLTYLKMRKVSSNIEEINKILKLIKY